VTYNEANCQARANDILSDFREHAGKSLTHVTFSTSARVLGGFGATFYALGLAAVTGRGAVNGVKAYRNVASKTATEMNYGPHHRGFKLASALWATIVAVASAAATSMMIYSNTLIARRPEAVAEAMAVAAGLGSAAGYFPDFYQHYSILFSVTERCIMWIRQVTQALCTGTSFMAPRMSARVQRDKIVSILDSCRNMLRHTDQETINKFYAALKTHLPSNKEAAQDEVPLSEPAIVQ